MSGPRYGPNDGRFPDGSQVEVRYPARVVDGEWRHVGALDGDEGGLERDEWPWLPGVVIGQCGPREWHVRVDVDDLAGDDPDQLDEAGRPLLWYPTVFRDGSELRVLRVDLTGEPGRSATAGRDAAESVGCEGCRVIGPLLTAPGTSGRSWRCESCGHVWAGAGTEVDR